MTKEAESRRIGPAGTKTWLDVVKALKSENESETTDSVEWPDSDEPKCIKADRAEKGQRNKRADSTGRRSAC